ncbi:hypothetical protein [Dyella sp. EPa41]|uniref:hypothetical protein n=1 Tax=Dyella sp. EPa41 TaxID=1561194 RepID=UPI001915691E|nr:hypothetical protein [Dyella sp. EPa41]
MGEAKKRLIRQRADFLRVLDQWSAEPSAGEMEALAAIQSLPVVRVDRVPADQLAKMRMKERLCHDNCAWYEANDPAGEWKAVTGWIVDVATGNFVLHAVIRSPAGEYACITPVPHVSARSFDFIPDPYIFTTRRADNSFLHVRNGHVFGTGVRPNPAKTIADVKIARAKIEAGHDPVEVLRSLSGT